MIEEAVGTHNLTSSPTRFKPPAGLRSAWLADVIANNRFKSRQSVEPDLAFVLGSKIFLGQLSDAFHTPLRDAASLAAAYERTTRLPAGYPPSPLSSAARSSITMSEHSLRQLIRTERREELMRRLSSERKATYDRIRRLREEIGPLNFDVVEELRNLRENG